MKKAKDDLTILAETIKAVRKSINKQFRQNDPYGRGLKCGLDSALRYVEQMQQGKKTYDPVADEMINPAD